MNFSIKKYFRLVISGALAALYLFVTEPYLIGIFRTSTQEISSVVYFADLTASAAIAYGAYRIMGEKKEPPTPSVVEKVEKVDPISPGALRAISPSPNAPVPKILSIVEKKVPEKVLDFDPNDPNEVYRRFVKPAPDKPKVEEAIKKESLSDSEAKIARVVLQCIEEGSLEATVEEKLKPTGKTSKFVLGDLSIEKVLTLKPARKPATPNPVTEEKTVDVTEASSQESKDEDSGDWEITPEE